MADGRALGDFSCQAPPPPPNQRRLSETFTLYAIVHSDDPNVLDGVTLPSFQIDDVAVVNTTFCPPGTRVPTESECRTAAGSSTFLVVGDDDAECGRSGEVWSFYSGESEDGCGAEECVCVPTLEDAPFSVAVLIFGGACLVVDVILLWYVCG